MKLALLVVIVVACSKSSNGLEALQREANAIADANQPKLDALVERIHALKRDLSGNLPGWETNWRIAELANDKLGLPSFTHTIPPGPGWTPSPASLLGMNAYVHHQADDLAKHGKQKELQFLVDDERRRYAEGIADVETNLSQVESWLARAVADRAHSPTPPTP